MNGYPTKEEAEQAEKIKSRLAELQEQAYREGWARGYERGFSAGVEACSNTKPKVALTDA